MDRCALPGRPTPDRTAPDRTASEPPAREPHARRFTDPDPLRAAALDHAERFRIEQLPKFLRRLGIWKGFDASRRSDLLDDLGQELFVLALEDPAALLAGDTEQRRRYLMRALQRIYYRLEWRSVRTQPLDIEALAIPSRGLGRELAPAELGIPGLAALVRAAEHRSNGRIHTTRTANGLRIRPERLRDLLIDTAKVLGFDDDREMFWSRRLGEVLLGEAAARLLERDLPRVWGRARRRRLEPGAGFRRVQRILSALDVRPLDPWLRQQTVRFSRVSCVEFERWSPDALLDLAAELLPADPRVALWQFEAAAHDGRLTAARQALTDAEHWRAEPIPLALARARLEELRGAPALALQLLSRALQDHPGDPRLRRSYEALRTAQRAGSSRPPRRYAPSVARRRSTTSRSKRA